MTQRFTGLTKYSRYNHPSLILTHHTSSLFALPRLSYCAYWSCPSFSTNLRHALRPLDTSVPTGCPYGLPYTRWLSVSLRDYSGQSWWKPAVPLPLSTGLAMAACAKPGSLKISKLRDRAPPRCSLPWAVGLSSLLTEPYGLTAETGSSVSSTFRDRRLEDHVGDAPRRPSMLQHVVGSPAYVIHVAGSSRKYLRPVVQNTARPDALAANNCDNGTEAGLVAGPLAFLSDHQKLFHLGLSATCTPRPRPAVLQPPSPLQACQFFSGALEDSDSPGARLSAPPSPTLLPEPLGRSPPRPREPVGLHLH